MTGSIELDHTEQKVSLCIECAKHPSVKRIIAQDSVVGLCAFCCRTDAQVRNPEHTEPMIMLLRALIRYHWDEWAYNRHWGGDSPIDLFSDPSNPIIKPPANLDYSDEFTALLEYPPYPDWDKGIAIYAGHGENGDRLLNFAISRRPPQSFLEFQSQFRTKNFIEIEPYLEETLKPFINDIVFELTPQEVWYRARLGHQAMYQSYTAGFMPEVRLQPWTGPQIGSPPPIEARAGRLNRSGVSMLYLASDDYTALAEVRPHPGHTISIGAFQSVEPIRLADFDPDIALFSSSDERLSQYAIINAFDRLMGTPVTPDERTPYLPTQLLSEVLLRHGFDGVRYRSSVAGGKNICVFRPGKFQFIDGSSQLRRLKSVAYDAPIEPMILFPGSNDIKIQI